MSAISSGYLSPQTLSPKESIWALYCRSMLLWNFSNRLRKDDSRANGEDEGQLALKASSEAQGILDLFDMHTCELDPELLSISREYLYGYVQAKLDLQMVFDPTLHRTQMMITQWFRRFVRSSDKCVIKQPYMLSTALTVQTVVLC
jgi:hypothetical protein